MVSSYDLQHFCTLYLKFKRRLDDFVAKNITLQKKKRDAKDNAHAARLLCSLWFLLSSTDSLNQSESFDTFTRLKCGNVARHNINTVGVTDALGLRPLQNKQTPPIYSQLEMGTVCVYRRTTRNTPMKHVYC